MKKLLIGIIAGVTITLAFSFKTIYDEKFSTAEVVIFNDLLIFTDCKPTMRYDVLGDVHIKMISSVDFYTEARSNLVKQAKEKFGNLGAEGIIITYPMTKNSYQAQVIRFKK